MFNTAVSVSATEETSSCETADDIPSLLTDLFGSNFMFYYSLFILDFRIDELNL